MNTADDLVGLGETRVAADPRDAEIHDHRHPVIHAVLQNHDVARLDITVNDASLVGIGQAIADVNDDPKPLRKSERNTLFDHRVQAGAFEVLHHQVGMAVLLAEVVDRNNVWALQGTGGPGF
jgi:hypothetical protein